MNDPLDIQDYLDASSEASKRARLMLIVMLVASALMTVGMLNSLDSSWMLRRIIALDHNGMKKDYAASFIGPLPVPDQFSNEAEYNDAKGLYRRRYEELNTAFIRSYVDSSLFIRVPFFGFSFDVNDLGLLGGIGFLIILGSLRFCLSRELENLHLSFEEAKKLGKLDEFYSLLAMKQVFTIPRTKYIRRTRFLVLAPKAVSLLPLVVYALVAWNDFSTSSIGDFLNKPRVRYQLLFESVTFVCLTILTTMIISRLIRLDALWKAYAPTEQDNRSIQPDPTLMTS